MQLVNLNAISREKPHHVPCCCQNRQLDARPVDSSPTKRKAVDVPSLCRQRVLECLAKFTDPQMELIWASPRELLNIFQADAIGCHIITATNDILKKLSLVGKDLDRYSL